jgi:subtilisin family serine protease
MAYEAWDEERGNPGVTIGIVDYGFDVNHEDLKDNIRYNPADPWTALTTTGTATRTTTRAGT